MKKNETYETVIFDIPVEKRHSDNFFNATKIFEHFNKKDSTSKRLFDFWNNESTKQMYLFACDKIGTTQLHYATRGKGGATWMHESLFNVLYNWLNKIPSQSVTRDEYVFCDYVIESFKGFLTFEKQKMFFGYKVDLYCNELNLCIEFDEQHHEGWHNKNEDLKRQSQIEKEYHVQFLRHKKGDNFSITINKIMQLWKKQ